MLERTDFKKNVGQVIDWIDNYFKELESLPVKSTVKPKDIYNQVPAKAPENGESLASIISDLDAVIKPGITHWQHPNFHAYFPGNSSVESLFAEFITAAIGAQCMIWDTSPAAAELEERIMEWLRDNMGIPKNFEGVIQDTASSATLAAILTAREVATGFKANKQGVPNNLRVYCSKETHSSIDKGVAVSGIGTNNLVKIAVDENMAMMPEELEKSLIKDIEAGYKPTIVIASIGTTGTVAVDPLKQIAEICKKYSVWLHVDAAYAGTALLLSEYQWMIDGIEGADSFVFNPHKWMFTNFDCSVYFVKNAELLIKTFEVLPEYLKTNTRGQVNDYRDWGIPLGRRFRALKLWFVIRSYGIAGLQDKIRKHIELNAWFANQIEQTKDFEIVTNPLLNFTAFRLAPDGIKEEELNALNQQLLEGINSSGEAFMSHTKVNGKYVLRMVIGQTYVEKKHIEKVLNLIRNKAVEISQNMVK